MMIENGLPLHCESENYLIKNDCGRGKNTINEWV